MPLAGTKWGINRGQDSADFKEHPELLNKQASAPQVLQKKPLKNCQHTKHGKALLTNLHTACQPTPHLCKTQQLKKQQHHSAQGMYHKHKHSS